MREVKLPSGAVLVVNAAPFADSKKLYQAILKEMKVVHVNYDKETNLDFANALKDSFCVGFSSTQIEDCLWECLKRCTYNGDKITNDTFEPTTAREDYSDVCLEVTKENVLPFGKSLYAKFKPYMEAASGKSQA